MRHTRSTLGLAAAAIVVAGLAGCAPSDSAASDEGSDSIEIGIITSKSGPLAAYGEAYLAGLHAGIDYATDGSGEVDGTAIELREGDDGADVDKAVQLAKEYIGDGVDILAGTVSSGVALALAEQAEQNEVLYISGPAAADAVTGINDYTFRSGRQSYQDVATAATFLDDVAGKQITVLAQDNAFGQGNVAAVQAVLGADGMGGNVTPVLVAEDVTEFTSFARQVLNTEPDLVFVAWAGETSGSMWQALTQQGVFDAAPVVTGLGDISTYGAYGAASDKIGFLSHYFGTAPDNDVNAAMVEALEADGHEPDLFSPDGFVAGQMLVHAISEGDDVDSMIDALEGWTFDGPKGSTTVRASDHALIQDMYQAKLAADGSSFAPELIEVVPADEVAPPEAG
ncbi:branched-chain amino acid transport system substrate-binding protein [Mumia flava]|uniref:Branched-chain amino acid transport system substrate-binding protein n=1 Tax=Mumia flava TaxID=1348852 RepID=A0A0B2BMQ3_9ACTN|nr:substrate-binding domain-containing protein [Mumia flava]PJJ56961.1 branched-chain amino acid transport system substrate-binding protein [Mumia flava]